MSATVVDAGDGLPLTVPALLHERAAQRGDHPWLICDNAVLTYAEADSRSAALAKGLLAVGAGRGTHVGLLHPNGPAFVIGWLAAARVGAVALPLSTFSTSSELATLLRTADIEILLATTSFRGRNYVDALREAVPGLDLGAVPPLHDAATPALRRVAFDGDGEGAGHGWTVNALLEAGATVTDDVLAAAESGVAPSDRMVIVHTSGSTSDPKGVIHQHGPLIRHLDNLNELRRYGEHEVLFSNSPFFWIGGFAYSLLGTLLAGATLVCSNATDASAALDLLERTRPTMVNGFAASIAHFAEDPSFPARDLTSIRRGNLWPIMPASVRPVDPELRHNMLGMTEAGSVCLASEDEGDQPEHRRGSFGQPVPGFEAKIVDPDTGIKCATGAVGELWFRGPFLMEGYYGRERHETFTPDGWYRTGDLFHVDGDGFYYFTGRRGDMIKTAGANVSPREVEAAILDATGLVAHVVGIDDADRGQVVAAALRVPRGQSAPDPDELRVALRKRLSAYKVPQRYLTLADEDVPMLSSGKLDARALKERFR
jgi:acyl-CoA synthetase (AMP-forming)/AMP-acid ligase II